MYNIEEDRPVRVEDVAREAGVSPITVSRTLSTPHKVRPETRERVMEAVTRTGYVLNSIASTLRSGRSSIVTVFTASLRNAHFASATQGTIDAFDGSRFHLMFAQTGYSERVRAEMVESVLPFRPAGLMFTGRVREAETRDAVRRLKIPVMEIWTEGEEPIDMLVGSSTYEGGRLMGAHFGERGYRRIAYCGHVQDRGGERIAGFREGLAAFGRHLDTIVPLEGTRSYVDGVTAFKEVRERLPDCDAIFFGTDLLAVGGMHAAASQGLAVPGDIAMAGYGDLDFAAHVRPSLTTIDVSDYEIGRRAGLMLRRRLEGGQNKEPVIHVPVTLQARQSTAPK